MGNLVSKGSYGASAFPVGMAGAGAGYLTGYMGKGGYLQNNFEMTSIDHGMGLGMMKEEFLMEDNGMALSGEFLNQYYSGVSTFETVNHDILIIDLQESELQRFRALFVHLFSYMAQLISNDSTITV